MQVKTFQYRLTFCKEEQVRFTSHLDIYRAWERTFRRAGLPLAYKQGFNPRPRLTIGNALPLGFTSSAELMDFWLEEEIEVKTIATALNQAQAPGLPIREVMRIPIKEPALQTQIQTAVYRVHLDDPPTAEEIQIAVETLMKASSLPRERRGKSYDLRPLIIKLQVKQSGDEFWLEMTLSASEGASGRPGEVLRAMGFDPTFAQIQRIKLILKSA
jgi:radical SAM-linked protein